MGSGLAKKYTLKFDNDFDKNIKNIYNISVTKKHPSNYADNTATNAPPAAPPSAPRPAPRSPVFARFRAAKRGWRSLLVLTALYAASLAAELITNDKPLFMRCRGESFFPVFRSYSHNDVLGDGNSAKITDYRQLLASASNGISRVVMPLFESAPHQTFSADDIKPYLRLEAALSPTVKTAASQLDINNEEIFSYGDMEFFRGKNIEPPGGEFLDALKRRFANQPAPAFEAARGQDVIARLAPYAPRPEAPQSVRVFLRSRNPLAPRAAKVPPAQLGGALEKWGCLSADEITNILAAAAAPDESGWIKPVETAGATVAVSMEAPSWPFRPIPGHPMGFDNAGRDVLARVIHAFRTSMTFGLLLIAATMLIAIIAGAVQGYFSGWADIAGQRFTEIWSALPFLYIMILLGNTLGRSFGLLLACYAAFNWIGAAAYVRAEFLRLRARAFVDAAKCQGLSGARIMFAHILPNALTPLITLLPFALVGAIGSLATLDYLGFGLPAGTPSWGELLSQAQAFRDAWWLILYPSLALFIVMLLGVFIGESLRDAFDPRPYSKMT